MSLDKFKPMLAGKAPPSLTQLNYPVMVSPKLDGVRVMVRGGRVVSRNLLEIPCPTVQELFGSPMFNGFDGELIVGDPTAPDAFRVTSSFVMRREAMPVQLVRLLKFYVFDNWLADELDFQSRLAVVKKTLGTRSKIFEIVEHREVINHHGVELYEEEWLKAGYEGLMIRDPRGLYKHGRSTTKEGGLLKLKRFEDAEAEIIGFKELAHNQNEDRTGGLAKRRSTKKAGKVGGKVLGAFQVRGLTGTYQGVTFDVGSGLSAEERVDLWQRQNALLGKVIRYAYFPGGSKDKPRFPTFQGLRDPRDL
jgi:DNA ligase 1